MCRCNTPEADPRDAASEAELALFGLRVLLNELPPDSMVPVKGLSPLIGLIHERLDPAVARLQGWRAPPPDAQ